MLDDTARKVLRILFNMNRMHAATLDMKRLELLAGRSEALVKETLYLLRSEHYIRLDERTNTVQVTRLEEQSITKRQHVFTD